MGFSGRDEIYAYGLRNPWRFSFTGKLMEIGDVGQTNAEEVDILPTTNVKGVNFGWPQYEGNLSTTTAGLDQAPRSFLFLPTTTMAAAVPSWEA